MITIAGKDVKSPQEAVEICPNVRGRVWLRALSPRSKYVKAPDHFGSTLEAWDLTIRRASRQSSMRDTRPQEGSAAADAYAQGTSSGIGGWCSAETQSVSPSSSWWFQLEGSMADLPQSWRAGTEALPPSSCFELLAQLALLVFRSRSPLPTSRRITLRQSFGQRHRRLSHHEGGSRQHISCAVSFRSSYDGHTISRIKLEADHLSGSTTSGPTRSVATRNSFPSEQRIESSVFDLLRLPRRVPVHDRWPDQLRKLESMNLQTLVPHGS